MESAILISFIKKQKAENKYNRIRLASANISIAKFKDLIGSAQLGIALGKEKHLSINDKLSFIKGWEFIGFAGSTFNEDDNYSVYITPGIGLVLGFQYEISNRFNIILETIPSVSTSISLASGNVYVTNFKLGFDSDNIALGLMYRF